MRRVFVRGPGREGPLRARLRVHKGCTRIARAGPRVWGSGPAGRWVRVSDRCAWLDQWCPGCGVAPGARCREGWYGSGKRRSQVQGLHIARGWRERACPTCKALPDDPCRTPSGRDARRAVASRRLHEHTQGRRTLADSPCRSMCWEGLGERRRRRLNAASCPDSGSARAVLSGQVCCPMAWCGPVPVSLSARSAWRYICVVSTCSCPSQSAITVLRHTCLTALVRRGPIW